MFEGRFPRRCGSNDRTSLSDCSDIIDAADNRLQEGSDASMPSIPTRSVAATLIFAVGLNSSSNRNTVWKHHPDESLFLL